MNYLQYNPNILAAELGKLFGLTLTPNMVSRDGWNFESGSGDRGILKLELMKGVPVSQMNEILAKARIPTLEEVKLQELKDENTNLREQLERATQHEPL